MARSPFIWSGSGEKLTPKEVERRRAMSALAAARGSDTSPIGAWQQGAARLIDAFGGYRGNVLAGKAEKEGQAGAKAVIDALMGGGGMGASMSSQGAPVQVVPPVVDGGGAFPESLIDSESGGNWNALNSEMGAGGVAGHGGRLQFGNARLADAARAGVIPAMSPQQFSQASPEVQKAVERWHFADIDRKAQEMGLTRYFGQTVGGVHVTPDAVRSMAHLGGIGGVAKFLESGGQYNPSDSFGTSLSDYGKKHGGGGSVSMSAMVSPSGGVSPVMQALIQASADPWVMQEYGPVVGALMEQEQARQQYEMQQADPLRQLQIQQAQLELEQARNPAPPKPIEVGGVLLDPTTFQPIFDSRTPKAADDPIAALRARAVEAGLQPGTPEYAAFMAAGGKPEGGMVIESDGQGGFRMVQGTAAGAAAGRPFTEGQSKDIVYATRARGALEVLEPIANSLTSRVDRAAEWDPTGLARGMQSDEFQVAKNAGDEFLQAILRKDTGAAITEQEQELYGKTYLPQPGDSPELLEAKRQARRRAIAAIEASMTPAQMLAQERGLTSSGSVPAAPADGGATPAGPETAPVAPTGPTRRLRYNPDTGALE